MKIDNQVCTVEQAMRLKELGVDAESFMRWVSDDDKEYELVVSTGYGWSDFPGYNGSKYIINAYSVSELGVMLPQTIQFCKTQKASIKISRFNAWTIYYNRHSSGSNVCMNERFNEAEARSAMLINLLENDFITATDVNQRLQSA